MGIDVLWHSSGNMFYHFKNGTVVNVSLAEANYVRAAIRALWEPLLQWATPCLHAQFQDKSPCPS